MKQEFILDIESIHLMDTIIELSGMTDNQFINLCIHHYGDTVKSSLANIATHGSIPSSDQFD